MNSESDSDNNDNESDDSDIENTKISELVVNANHINTNLDFDSQLDDLTDDEFAEIGKTSNIDNEVDFDDTNDNISHDDDDSDIDTIDSFDHMIPKYIDPTQKITAPIQSKHDTLISDITIIRGDARITYSILTDFELASALAHRATMLSKNNPPLIIGNIDPDPIKVAEDELNQGLCPILIYRPVGNNKFEEFSVNELYGISSPPI
jgi:DNA-directed RNA polymerase subunit K/omega